MNRNTTTGGGAAKGTGQWRWLALTAAIIGVDQWSKRRVESALRPYEVHYYLPVFNLVRAHNRGAAFSLFDGTGGWQRWAFSALAAVVCVSLVIWLKGLERRANLLAAGLALILGGALGNVLDRLRLGFVIDFLQVHWQQHYFPAFNVADSAITVGAGCLLIDVYLSSRRHSAAAGG